MAAGLNAFDRRLTRRLPPERTSWHRLALLRPGREVVLINISVGGALVECSARLRPGTRTELQLAGTPRRSLGGRIDRCRVSSLDPLCYEAAIVFDDQLRDLVRSGSGE